MKSSHKVLVVGCGFSGAVIARVLAENNLQVDIVDRREHIGGNAYDLLNEQGIRIHKYGPHLFHTSNEKVVRWLSRFTEWLSYKHRVKALLADGRHVTLPVNKETADMVGHENIIDVFFRPYTRKMWGIELEQLDSSILERVPVRDDFNEFYFPNDSFQALPKDGYTALFQRMLDHPRIRISLGVAFHKSMEAEYNHVFNSMPIDEYFDYELGELPYRSIKFHHLTLPMPAALPVATVNFTHDGPYTRVTEWKKLPGHGDSMTHTALTFEEPCDYKDNQMERYYPVKDRGGVNLERYRQYKAKVPGHMTFMGRCGQYAYLDMHQAISSALAVASAHLNT